MDGMYAGFAAVRRLYALWVPANTPWNRVRACPGLDPGLTLGFGTRAALSAMRRAPQLGQKPRSLSQYR